MTKTRLDFEKGLMFQMVNFHRENRQEFLKKADKKSMKFQLVIASSLLFILSSCVTVDVGGPKSEPAKNVSYSNPPVPFRLAPAKNTDRLWISSDSGNSISYLSDCGGAQEPTLEQLENEALASLVDLKILRTEKVEYNNREALKTLAEGKVDGVKVKMSLLTLKKNNCNYTLIYGGVSKNFDKEEKFFQNFIQDFKAP